MFVCLYYIEEGTKTIVLRNWQDYTVSENEGRVYSALETAQAWQEYRYRIELK